MRHKFFLVLMVTLNLSFGACAHSLRTESGQVTLTKIRSGQQMAEASKTPGCKWVANENQFSGLLNRIGKGTRIPTKPITLPEIDFAAYGVLAIWMGQMPTGGYALELMTETAEIKNQTALVPVRWIKPKRGLLTTQIITHPYLMIRMGKGNYKSIAVIDHNGLVKTRVDLTDE